MFVCVCVCSLLGQNVGGALIGDILLAERPKPVSVHYLAEGIVTCLAFTNLK